MSIKINNEEFRTFDDYLNDSNKINLAELEQIESDALFIAKLSESL